MPIGKVKWWDDEKGFGFITGESGEDIFVHSSSIQSQGYQSLKDGSKVEFEVKPGSHGPMAYNVRFLDVINKPSSLQQEVPSIYAASFSAPTVREIEYKVNEHVASLQHQLINVSILQAIDGQGYVALATIKRG